MSKFLKYCRFTLLPLVFLAGQVIGRAQTYQFTAPATGYLELHVSDYAAVNTGTNATSSGAYPNINFSSIAETVTFDPVNNTLRQVGYITVSNPAPVGILTETRQIDGQTVDGTVTVQQSITNGMIPFDTGFVAYNTFNPSFAYYSSFDSVIQIEGSYSLVTGGHSYLGDFSPEIFPNSGPGFGLPFYNVAQSSNGSSLQLFGQATGGYVSAASDVNGMISYFGITASNGFTINLRLGGQQTFDPFLVFSLNCTNSVTASLVAATNSPARFFNGQSYSSTNVYFLQFTNSTIFGYYNLADYPYVYHYDLGWEYFIDGGNAHPGDAYLYDFASGHFWFTSTTLFPYLYDFSLNSWLYYYPSQSDQRKYTSSPRQFYDFATGTVVNL